ncbi:MAG: hypothetical protein HYV47_01965 [Candidatus Nealsonbacteria bacterium]|nr:hypothetical protein [Candidatus Nealsonbacteria bacterium]
MKKKISFVILVLVLIIAAGLAGCSGKIKGDGKYDYNYDLVSFNPVELTNFQGVVFLTVLDGKRNPIFTQSTLAWVRDNEVIVPSSLFYLPTPSGQRQPSWFFPGISIELILSPIQQQDGSLKGEKLSDILNNEDLVAGGIDFAVVQRIHPVFSTAASLVLGNYKELSEGRIDKALYTITQVNGRIIVGRSEINEIYVNKDHKNLFGVSGILSFYELGGLAFAVRDGKPELVGFLSPMEMSQYEAGKANVYYLDIQQIVDYLEKLGH